MRYALDISSLKLELAEKDEEIARLRPELTITKNAIKKMAAWIFAAVRRSWPAGLAEENDCRVSGKEFSPAGDVSCEEGMPSARRSTVRPDRIATQTSASLAAPQAGSSMCRDIIRYPEAVAMVIF